MGFVSLPKKMEAVVSQTLTVGSATGAKTGCVDQQSLQGVIAPPCLLSHDLLLNVGLEPIV